MSGPTHRWSRQEQNNLIADAMRFDQYEERVLFDQSILSFSSGQNSAFNTIPNVIDNGLRPNTFFLQGPAGTGKTFLYKVLCNYYRSKGDIFLCVASSGIASLLLPGRSIAHSQFRIPIDCPDGTRCSINRQSPLAGLLKKTRLIIWDEVTMQLKHNFVAVDLTLRDIMQNQDDLFGGIPVVLGGDFAQILPVVRRGRRENTANACIRFWDKWSIVRPLFLTQNMRVIEGELNQRFADWLAKLSYTPSLYGPVELPDFIRVTHDREEFREFVYPIQQIRTPASSFFRERAILSSRNDEVDKFNDNLSHLIGANYHSYYSLDTTQNDQSRHVSDYTPEFLRTVSGQGLPPGKLTLHVGMPVMLLRNYYSREGLINGCRLIITRLYNHCLKSRITSADSRFDGNEHIISRINLSCDENLSFTLIRKQLPLRPCYAMTINKSQGQMLKYAGVDLITPVFSHGQ
ncbi:hypothetical protein EPUL_006433, partial [Erysiphe pulchra]